MSGRSGSKLFEFMLLLLQPLHRGRDLAGLVEELGYGGRHPGVLSSVPDRVTPDFISLLVKVRDTVRIEKTPPGDESDDSRHGVERSYSVAGIHR
jgi:hypothetical protein